MGIAHSILNHLWRGSTTMLGIIGDAASWFVRWGAVKMFVRYVSARPLTWETLFLAFENWPAMLNFLVDLMEPMKNYAAADSEDGKIPYPTAAKYSSYNELNLTEVMNRHSLVCQIQRLIKSVIPILSNGMTQWTALKIDTVLESDRQAQTATTEVSVHADPTKGKEEWLFINGICNEYHWTVLSVKKLVDRFFSRKATETGTSVPNGRPGTIPATTLKGVFNRSDGILWDLIECGSQRDFGEGHIKEATEVTKSSKIAQKLLRDQIKLALENEKQDIVMIAHSQGCLILRLVLRDFENHQRYPEYHKLLPRMRKHVSVYTFGNPAFEWSCHNLVRHTEHFANTSDFVARLGVLGSLEKSGALPPSRGRYTCKDCQANVEGHPKMLIWENERTKGYLFGSQYSLDQADYKPVFPSKSGNAMSELLSRNVKR